MSMSGGLRIIWIKTYTLLALGILLALGLVFFLFPETRFRLTEEDRFVENVTVFVFLATVVTAIYGLFIGKRRYAKSLMMLFLAVALFAALEEISYGERYLGFKAPRIFDYKMDTIHDFVFLFFKTIKVLQEDFGVIVFALAGGMAATFLYILYRLRVRLSSMLVLALRDPSLFYVFLFTVLGVTSLVIDLGALKVADYVFL
ncbi:MAG: hypothetical protein ACREXR_03140, partial [Gammaproteobacteria bacterium]